MKRLAAMMVCLFAFVVQGFCGDKLINVQGKLTDNMNNPIAGNRVVTFRLYNSTADPLTSWIWQDNMSVNFSSGLYNVALGQGANSLDGVPFNKPYYLGMQISGDANEMKPRQLLGASAYSLGSLGDFNVKGKVGIGTTSPTFPLEVMSDVFPQLVIRHKTVPSYGIMINHRGEFDLYPGDSTSTYKFSMAGSEKMRITSTGKVGIGTTNPSAPLEVRSDSDPQFIIGHQTSSSYMMTINHAGIFDMPNGNSDYRFRIAGSDRLVVANNGNVGVGTTSPADKFHVAGNVRVDGGEHVYGSSQVDGDSHTVGNQQVDGSITVNGTIRGASWGFGGMYSRTDNNDPLYPNPITGGYSCPGGFSSYQVGRFYNIEIGKMGNLFMCIK